MSIPWDIFGRGFRAYLCSQKGINVTVEQQVEGISILQCDVFWVKMWAGYKKDSIKSL